MLCLCLQEQSLREQQPAQQPGRNTKRFAVFSDSCKCKLMHYLQDTSKQPLTPLLPFQHRDAGVPVSLEVRCGLGAAALGWGGSSGEPRARLGKPEGNIIKKGARREKKIHLSAPQKLQSS